MSKGGLFCALILLMAVVVSVGYWQGRGESARDALSVPLHRLDLGTVWAADEHEFLLPFENQSRYPIKIQQLASTCGCLSITPASFSVQPGDVQDVAIVIDLTAGNGAFRHGTSHPFEFAITALYEREGARRDVKSWKVHGIARSPFTISDLTLDFGNDLVVGIEPPARIVSLSMGEDVSRIEAEPADDTLHVEIEPKGDEVALLDMVVTPTPPATVGRWDAEIRTRARLGRRWVPGPSIHVLGYVGEEIVAVPSRLEFGQLEIDSASRQRVLLQSRSRREFRVESIRTNGQGLSVTKAETHVLELKQCGLVAGRQTGSAKVSVKWLDGDDIVTVDIPISYYGVLGK